jgi:hypothetical protein
MAPLHDALRRELEKTIIKARDVAEAGARAALARLTVGDREPGAHLGADDRVLRNRLRAHARQLGDRRNERTCEQEIDRLTQEVAYEAWHRMLFARFLAENRLLIQPEMRVPVSLEECEELAAEEGIGDGWVLASRYAARMLPEIFRPDDPVLQVPLAPEHQQELERLVGERTLPRETFLADDALGWVYQYWQTRRKDEVNASGEKITGETLPAVTQLFTEPYMVSFLLENTIGAWWIARNPGRKPPIALHYLRQIEDGAPAAGTFAGWPETWRHFTLLDPCCGSGHFLVAALKLIVPLRMHDEGMSARAAVDAALGENLHGLELDARCTQIAAFALALAAWTFPGAGGYRPLPELHVACSGLAVGSKREDWTALAEGDRRLERALGELHALLNLASELGSLINPNRGTSSDLWTASAEEARPLVEQALRSERVSQDANREAAAVAAHGAWKAAELLGQRYTLVSTNVPYLTRGKQNLQLRDFADEWYPDARQDLATVFLSRCLDFSSEHGTTAVVSPQNWFFQDYYAALRRRLLNSEQLLLAISLGPGAFSDIGGEVVKPSLVVLERRKPDHRHQVSLLDTTPAMGAQAKEAVLLSAPFVLLSQSALLANPDARIALTSLAEVTLLGEHASYHNGIQSGDYSRFGRLFWEITEFGTAWSRQQSTVERTSEFSGREHVFLWEGGKGAFVQFVAERLGGSIGAWVRGKDAWGRRGIAVSAMGSLPVTIYTGELFDDNTVVLIPNDEADLPALWCFCSSDGYRETVRKIDKALKVRGPLIKVPFDRDHWMRVSEVQYPDGLPEPASDDPTQWLFKGDIASSVAPLQVAVARLLGYRWPDQTTNDAVDALSDQDGIVCLPPVRGERGAADRLSDVLRAGYAEAWTPANLEGLLSEVGYRGRSLELWLRDGFFDQHVKLFHQRPFIWQVWDGRKDGFSALVNYHKLNRASFEALTYTYLGDWINRQEEGKQQGIAGAEARLVAARDLQNKLKCVLTGEPPFDLFVRWKPLHEQPIGWEPDQNDGIRLNIFPFVTAGILRSRVNVHWKMDRGMNPAGSPWGEQRWNRYEDISPEQRPEYLRDAEHLSTEIKRRAREAHARGLPPSRLHEVGA